MTIHPTAGPGPDFSSERGEKASPERADVLGGAATSLGHGSFDDHHPPAQELLDDCVHCGFCLPTCPTYALWGEEMDSPRGRIYLMEMAAKGEIPLEGAFTTHIDRCLGCMACVTACPPAHSPGRVRRCPGRGPWYRPQREVRTCTEWPRSVPSPCDHRIP